MLVVRRFKVEQIYYILYLTANKYKAIYRELLAIWDATVLHHQVIIKFYIFNDTKTRARLYYNNDNEQYPNTELWRNPYNNVLDGLFEGLGNEGTESLKAVI